MMPPESKASHKSSGDMPSRLTLHGPHAVLRKISRALRVRIDPGLDVHGPYVVIDDVTPAEVAIIAQILDG